jgi:hypothetical protein
MSAIKHRAIQRGRLLERIVQQRSALALELAPLTETLHRADRVIEGAEKTRRWIGENPLVAATALIALLIWRPKGVVQLVKNGAVGWRTFRLIRRLLA